MSSSQYLTNFPFTDLYVRLDADGFPSRYRPDITRLPSDKNYEGNFQVPEKYDHHMETIRKMVEETNADEGTITHQGLRMRFAIVESEGERWASLRAVPLEVPDFERLGHNPAFLNKMKQLAKRKGLIIVGGKTGDGKTTTCVSMLMHFLNKHGGLLFTIEDPPEYAIQGRVSDNAFCLQNEIKNEDWARAAKCAMRSRPDYILFGEIRTPEAAESLLKTLTSGHLVVATIHAGEVSDTIAALMQMAEHRLGRVARDSLADRLLAAVHQTMTREGPKIECVIPVLEQENDRKQMIDVIKAGDYANINRSKNEFLPLRTEMRLKGQAKK